MSESTSVYTVGSTSPDFELTEMPAAKASSGDVGGKDGGGRTPGLKELMVMYASKSTVHGLPSTVAATQYRGQRLFWLLLVVGMGVALGTVLTLQIQDYYSYPTVIDIHEKYLTVHDIPEITICKQETKVFRGSVDWSSGSFSYGSIALESIHSPPPRDCGTTDHVPGECLLNFTRQQDLTKLLVAGLDYLWLAYNTLTQVVTDMGVCNTFKTSDFITNWIGFTNHTRMVPLDIMLAVKDRLLFGGEREGLQVSLHLKDEPPFPRTNRVQVAVNKSCRVRFKKVKRRSLTTPYVSFVGEQCVETHLPSFKNPLTRYSVYSKDTCLEECFVNFTIAQCGCRYYLHPGWEEMCNYTTAFRCMQSTRYDFRGHKRDCTCPPPCEYTQFETSVSCSEINRPPLQMIHLEIISDTDMMTEIAQIPVYSLETILASLGGLIGLFMGFSVVSIIELLELVTFALSCNLCNSRRST